MTSVLPSKKPQVRPAIDGSRSLTKSSRRGSASLQQDVNLPQTSEDVHFGLVAIVKTENVLSDSNTAIRGHYDVTEPKSFKEDAPNCLHHFELAAPSMSSPTESASAPSSPGAGSDIWDSPETPSNKTVGESAIEVFTPLTPPTTYQVSVEHTSITKAHGSLLTDNAVISDEIKALIPYAGDDEDEQRAGIQDEGYFKPKKLIRNLTKELQARKSRYHDPNLESSKAYIASLGSECCCSPIELQCQSVVRVLSCAAQARAFPTTVED